MLCSKKKKEDKNQLPITKKALLQFVLDISTIENLTFYFIVANSWPVENEIFREQVVLPWRLSEWN